MRFGILILPVLLMAPPDRPQAEAKPLRLAIVGLVHGHARGFLDRMEGRTDVELVGIADADAALVDGYRERYGLSREQAYTTAERMLDAARPEAGGVFT